MKAIGKSKLYVFVSLTQDEKTFSDKDKALLGCKTWGSQGGEP
jgi:hypothetical protein